MVITSDRSSYFSGEKKGKIIGTGEFIDNSVRILRLPISREFKGRSVRFVNLKGSLEFEKPDYTFHNGMNASSLITAIEYKKKTFFGFSCSR